MKKIFISSTREDLQKERNKLINFVDRMPDCKAVAMEKFSASKDRPKELCLSELRGSNLLILLLGFKYGSIDVEEGLSFTEIEYNTAKELGKSNIPVFVFQKRKDGKWIADEQDVNKKQKLEKFKSKLDVEKGRATFETLDGLIEEVSLTLMNEKIERERLESYLNPLISYRKFFKPFLNKNNYFNHSYAIVGRKNVLKSLKNFIDSDKKIAIIQGGGGIGKSRILFEFSQNIQNNEELELNFLNEHILISNENFPQLPKEKFAIVIDDAHRRDDEEITLLLSVLQNYPDYKVIIACRPYGLGYIKNSLSRAGIETKEIEYLPEIKELESIDLEKLGLEILGKKYQHLVDSLIHVADGSPLVMVVGGNLIKEKKINPILLERQQEFQSVVFDRFRDELIGEISDIDKTLYKEILSLISALSPINTNIKELYTCASEFLEIKTYEFIRNIDLLETSGILLRRGEVLKITPDVLSDHILHNACVTKRGQGTGYAQRIFHKFWDIIPQNMLLNLSELDWRIRQEKEVYSLLYEIWAEIETEFKEASNSRRLEVLSYLERIAIFHPAKTLKIVEFVMQNPSKIIENENLHRIAQNTHINVLHKLPSLLEVISYHLDYLPRCCELLWELARDDQRTVNSYPSHPMKVLLDIAKYDINKDLIFNSTVLDCVEKWMNDLNVHEHSLLDILDQFLAKEETTEEVKGLQINFYPFSVSYENTKDIRRRTLALLSECTKLNSTKIKLRVFKSLYDVLWPPHGEHSRAVSEDELNKWIPEQIEVLKIIENLVINTDDPILLIQSRKDLKRVSRALKNDQSLIANRIADSINNSFDLQITQVLWNQYDTYEEDEDLSYFEMLDRIENIKIQLASELLRKCDDSQEVFNYLENKLSDLKKAGVKYDPDEFFIALGNENYKIALEMCRTIISKPENILSPYLSALMSGIRKEDKRTVIDLSKLTLKTNDKRLIYSLALGYGGRSWASSLDDEDIDLIKELLDYPDEDVKSLAIESLGRFKGKFKLLAIELALKIDIRGSDKLADAFCYIFGENSIKIEELKYDNIKCILDKLVKIKEIDHHRYSTQRLIGYFSSKYPHLVIDFLFDRILLSTKEKWTWPDTYEPLPHEFHFKLKITEHSDYKNILRKVRDKVLDPNFSDYWISKLFIEISDDLSSIALQVLCEWVNSNNVRKIEAAVSLLKHANPDFVFVNVEFVSRLLDNAYSLDNDSYIKIRNKLINLTNFRLRRMIRGRPSHEDTKIKEESQKIAEKFPINSLTKEFYSSLFKNAEEAEKTSIFTEEEFE